MEITKKERGEKRLASALAHLKFGRVPEMRSISGHRLPPCSTILLIIVAKVPRGNEAYCGKLVSPILV